MLLFCRPSELLTNIGRSNRKGIIHVYWLVTSYYFFFFLGQREAQSVSAKCFEIWLLFFPPLHLPADRQYVIDYYINHFEEMS